MRYKLTAIQISLCILFSFSYASAETGVVVDYVIDGDTINAKVGETSKRIRLIGIDAPELHTTPMQCFGKEARDYLDHRLKNKTVELVQDSMTGDEDKYGRLLRYIKFEEKDINQELLELGYARYYPYFKFSRSEKFKMTAQSARMAERGLWSQTSCPVAKITPTPKYPMPNPLQWWRKILLFFNIRL